MKKFVYLFVIMVLLSSEVQGYSISSLRNHEENVKYFKSELSEEIENTSNGFKIYVENGNKCDKYLSEFREIGKNVYLKAEDLSNSVNKLDYLTDSTYKELKEEDKLLNEKKDLLQDGGTLTTTRKLSDGTEVIETFEGYNGQYDDRLKQIGEEMSEIRKYYETYAMRMYNAGNEINDWMTNELLGKCFTYQGEYKKQLKENEINKVDKEKLSETNSDQTKYGNLYSKLDQLENKKPGTLKTLLPTLEKIKTQKKYKNQVELLNVIIDYIEVNYNK